MTNAHIVKNQISQMPIGAPFSSNLLRHLASTDNLRQILNRLVKSGELKRVGRGIFMRIEKENGVDITLSTQETIKTLQEMTGETIAIYGAEAARQMQLSTQVPMRPVYYTSGKTRIIKLAGKTVSLRHASPSKLALAGTFPGLVISAIDYLGKKNTTQAVIKKIHQQIGQEKFNEVFDASFYMPPWMAQAFYFFQQTQDKGSS